MKEIRRNLGRSYYEDGATPSNLHGAVSKSMLWEFNKSPFKWMRGVKQTSPAMDFGILVHSLCLTPDKVEDEIAVSPFDSYRTKEARQWRDDQQCNGKTVVTEADMERATEMRDAMMESQEIYQLGGSEYEVACYNDIGDTQVKCMIDIVPFHGDTLCDIKTIDKIVSIEDLTRRVMNFGYHWQGALYLDMWNALNNQNREQFMFAFIEKEPPYEMAFVTLSADFILKGREGYMNAIAKWQQCLSDKKFKRTIEGVQELELPAWALK